MLKLKGYASACIGMGEVWQRNADGTEKRYPTYIYSGPAIIKILMGRDGMRLRDAYEFLDSQIVRAHMGPQTPIISWPAHHEES